MTYCLNNHHQWALLQTLNLNLGGGAEAYIILGSIPSDSENELRTPLSKRIENMNIHTLRAQEKEQ